MRIKLFLYVFIPFVIFLESCTSTENQGALNIAQPIAAYEGIVILSDIVNPLVKYSDRQVDECLGEWMRKYNSKLKFFPARQFREQLYPYFSSGTAPHTTKEYQTLINNHLVKERIKSMQVRYLIVQHEAQTSQDGHGAIIPFAGPGAGGVIGLAWWNRHTAFSAQLWDLKTGEVKGDIISKSEGTGVIPAIILPIPIYLPATEKASCKELAKRLASALTMN